MSGTQTIDDELRTETVAEQSDDAVDVAHRRYFGRADHDGFVGTGDGVAESEFDARRTVDQHVVEALAQRGDQRLHLLGFDFVFFTRLRRREQEEIVAMLVGDERVVDAGALFEDVEQVMLDAALQSEHDVEIAQTDVGIDENDARAAGGQRRTEVGGRRRFADAALSRGQDDGASYFGGRRAGRGLGLNGLHLMHAFTPLSMRP